CFVSVLFRERIEETHRDKSQRIRTRRDDRDTRTAPLGPSLETTVEKCQPLLQVYFVKFLFLCTGIGDRLLRKISGSRLHIGCLWKDKVVGDAARVIVKLTLHTLHVIRLSRTGGDESALGGLGENKLKFTISHQHRLGCRRIGKLRT